VQGKHKGENVKMEAYQIQQQIDDFLSNFHQNVIMPLEKFKQELDDIYEVGAVEAERQKKRKTAEEIFLRLKVINLIYFGGVDIPFKHIAEDWWSLAKVIREDIDWRALLETDKNLRQEVLRLTSSIQKNLEDIKRAAESLFRFYPFDDDDQIQEVKKNILFHLDEAQKVISNIREYVEKVTSAGEEQPEAPDSVYAEEERQPVGPVKRAISAIRSLMQRIFPTEKKEEEISEGDKNNEVTPG
jgi:ElaB/YqjD/DUF883 family membrane-anchored ribosome-binding protein